MNVYKALNRITKYIDDNLENKIDYEVLAKMLGTNVYTMQKLFSLLTNMPLSEYIRKRRLSSAGYDFSIAKEKVMDVAIKYKYENATSFSRAFFTFHGIDIDKNSDEIKYLFRNDKWFRCINTPLLFDKDHLEV